MPLSHVKRLVIFCFASVVASTALTFIAVDNVHAQGDVIILNGSSTCPWCDKQKAYFDKQGIPYEFKDCDKGECRDGILAYPTLDNVVGYHELSGSDDVILNGSSTCPWCDKQKAYFDNNGTSYEFRDCDKGECREGIVAYPTLDNIIGYHEF